MDPNVVVETPSAPTATGEKASMKTPLTLELIERMGQENQGTPETPSEGEVEAQAVPVESQEGKTEQEPTPADSGDAVELYETGPNGEKVPIKAADIIKGATYPVKIRGKRMEVSYDQLVTGFQKGVDADRVYQRARQMQAEMPSQIQAQAQALAVQMFNAEMAKIRQTTPGEPETPEAVPQGLTAQQLQAELDRRDGIRQSAELRRQDDAKTEEVRKEVLSGFEAKFKGVEKGEKLLRSFNATVQSEAIARVKQAFHDNGNIPITHDELRGILSEVASEAYNDLKEFIPAKPATQKALPKTPPIGTSGGKAPVSSTPIKPGAFKLGTKLTAEQIDALGKTPVR